jgi:hypothetical protein
VSYKKLEIWQLAREVSIEIHELFIKTAGKHEMLSTGSQYEAFKQKAAVPLSWRDPGEARL